MQFLSNGDYIFPFHASDYWAQHLYTWSFQHGAPNPDGILRIPGRVFDLLFFALFGNIAFGYFYAITCLAIAFLAFWWFARVFLEIPVAAQHGADWRAVFCHQSDFLGQYL